jgi:phospholipid transport system substrate-binding protein
MIRLRALLWNLLIIGMGSFAGTAAGAPLTAAATLRQKNDELCTILRRKVDAGTPAAETQRVALKQLTDSLLSYDAFARQSLGEHWDAFQKRDEFLAAFKAMLEHRYLRQLSASLDDRVVYESEAATAQEATVTTVVKRGGDGRLVDEEIVYKLHRVNSAWMVRDIISDEVSLVRNYKTQFHKIITEQGADKLIEKIKSKL